MSQKCPFCGAGSVSSINPYEMFRCGTRGPDVNGEYSTGTECDKTVFRNGFQRCLALLQEVTECGVIHTSPNRYHEVQIPHALWESIRHEVGWRDGVQPSCNNWHGCKDCGEENLPRIVAGQFTCPECGSLKIVNLEQSPKGDSP